MMHAWMPWAAPLMQSVGWSLIHSLWQGALIYLVLSAVLRAFPGMSARLRHGCALMAMMLLSSWVVNTAVTQWQRLSTTPVRIISGDAGSSAVAEASVAVQGIGGIALPQLVAIMPWLMLCYALGLLAMLLRFAGGLSRLHQLRHSANILPSPALQSCLESLKAQLGLTQTVLLRISTHVAVPLVVGALRPLILLPASLVEELSPEGLEAILLHELAHISRADFLINIFQTLIETLLFFNPFVWRMSALIRIEREHCCDDLVIACTRQPLAYAHALSSIARLGLHETPPMALAAAGRPPLLLNRIKRIVEMKNQSFRYGHVFAACCMAAFLIAVSIVCFTPSLAQHKSKDDDRKPARSHEAPAAAARTAIVVIDSSGARREYSDVDQLPPRVRVQLLQGLKGMNDAEAGLLEAEEALEAIGEAPLAPPPPSMDGRLRSPGAPKAAAIPPIPGAVPRAPQAPELPAFGEAPELPVPPGVAWNRMSRHVDTAMIEMSHVDWDEINREISKSMVIVRKTMDDPKIRAEVQRSMAIARKQLAANRIERQRALADNHQSFERTSRELERAKRRMERARRELEQAREQVQQLQQKRR